MNEAKYPARADLVLTNAHIITMDSRRPRAGAVVIGGGRILSLHDERKPDTSGTGRGRPVILDCRGRTILPGFMDAHAHLISFAESLTTLNLGPRSGVRSITDIQSRIKAASREMVSGSWIRGKGYDEFYLAEKRHPNRRDLDRAAPSHPLKLTHRSGHAHVLNTKALELVGISGETADPPGGLIDRQTGTGEPTGVLYEMGAFLSKLIPPLDEQELERGITMANRELISLGVTAVQDASARNNRERWSLFQSWKQRGVLKPRVSMMLGREGFKEYGERDFPHEIDRSQLRIQGVKIIVDETTGQLNPAQSELNQAVMDIHSSGGQAAVHAIEEHAVESACIAIEYALHRLPRPDHRHRIEHCSVCPPALSERLAALGVMVVTQPPFIYYNGDRYRETVPDRQFQYLYPIGTLMKSGVKVAGSSDCPIVPPNPLKGIYSAVSRLTETGRDVMEKEGIPILEALRMYSGYAAESNFGEAELGSITPGKLADLVVLNGDPIRLPPDEIKDLEVTMTIINGEIAWVTNG